VLVDVVVVFHKMAWRWCEKSNERRERELKGQGDFAKTEGLKRRKRKGTKGLENDLQKKEEERRKKEERKKKGKGEEEGEGGRRRKKGFN